MPKFLTFNYTKESGEESERVILTITTPTDLYLCFDITNEIEDPQWSTREVLSDLEKIRAQYYERIYKLGQEYGFQVKTFKQGRMSNINDITKEYSES
jgi:hypothetical protein